MARGLILGATGSLARRESSHYASTSAVGISREYFRKRP